MIEINGRRSLSSIGLAGTIVSAYVSNNSVPMSELPSLIGRIHAMVIGLVDGTATDTPIEIDRKPTPAQIHESVTPDALISFINGKAYRTLKRHLTGHGLDPRSYRERYGLPADYPMAASSYRKQRSEIAKAIGLGQPRAHGDQRRTETRGSR